MGSEFRAAWSAWSWLGSTKYSMAGSEADGAGASTLSFLGGSRASPLPLEALSFSFAFSLSLSFRGGGGWDCGTVAVGACAGVGELREAEGCLFGNPEVGRPGEGTLVPERPIKLGLGDAKARKEGRGNRQQKMSGLSHPTGSRPRKVPLPA